MPNECNNQSRSPYQLKQQYASDILKLVPNNRDKVTSYLSENNYPFEQRTNHIRVYIPNSLQGLQILDSIRDSLSSFEVIQGTMDDVFIKITGKNIKNTGGRINELSKIS